MLILENSKN